MFLFPTVNKSTIWYREMLGGSVSDLRSTMCELQERLQSVDGEGQLK